MSIKPIKEMTLHETVFYLEVTLKKLGYLEVLLDMWKAQHKQKNKNAKAKIVKTKKDIQDLEKRKENIKERIFFLCGKRKK